MAGGCTGLHTVCVVAARQHAHELRVERVRALRRCRPRRSSGRSSRWSRSSGSPRYEAMPDDESSGLTRNQIPSDPRTSTKTAAATAIGSHGIFVPPDGGRGGPGRWWRTSSTSVRSADRPSAGEPCGMPRAAGRRGLSERWRRCLEWRRWRRRWWCLMDRPRRRCGRRRRARLGRGVAALEDGVCLILIPMSQCIVGGRAPGRPHSRSAPPVSSPCRGR